MWRNVLQPLRLGGLLVLSSLIVVFFGVFNALAELDTIPATQYTWSSPIYGTAVHHYFVEVRVNDNELLEYDFVPSTSIMLQLEYGKKYEVRVAGVDADGHRGWFSRWSLAYSPELGPPGF